MSNKDIFKSIVDRSITEIIIPSKITSIGDSAFFGCTSLSSVSIHNNVLSIGNRAFQSCKALTDINISNSVTSIGDFAFFECSSLTNITIPNGVISIGNNAFQSAGLTSITIPNSVTSIGDASFKGTDITNATIGSGVSSIGEFVFADNYGALILQTIRFNQPSGMAITLPTAGSTTGMFYCKTASNLTIYTDNETIKNYDYASDNVTPTFYHLDGSAWA